MVLNIPACFCIGLLLTTGVASAEEANRSVSPLKSGIQIAQHDHHSSKSNSPMGEGGRQHGSTTHHHDTVPTDLDLLLTRDSSAGLYRVTLTPPVAPVALNRLHSYELTVTRPDGKPVEDAHISIDGGMPQHGHGLPTAPQVTRQLGDGRYLVEGVLYSMAGWWELRFTIEAAPGIDKVVFNLVSNN